MSDKDIEESYVEKFNKRVRHMIKNEGLIDMKLFPVMDKNTTAEELAKGALELLDAKTVPIKDIF